MTDGWLFDKLGSIERRLEAVEAHVHEPGYHEHLIDHEEHARLHEKKDNRKGERRGEERRKSSEGYTGEERRA
jgi:hypothetical protein